MAHVVALYRYPVKGLTPESRDSLDVRAEGRIAGDRVLGFRFADTPEADDAWSSKHGMLVLVNTPGLARLQVHFDDVSQRLQLHTADLLLADEALDDAGRARLCEAMANYALSLDENPLSGHPERLPLRLVGDGVSPRYHDSPAGGVSLHSRASLRALAEVLHDPEMSELRFRSNVAIEGIDAWEEMAWEGKTLRIGGVPLEFQRPKVRCLATHANPLTGARDLPVMTTLTRSFGQEKPTFAVGLTPLAAGTLRLGDEVTLG